MDELQAQFGDRAYEDLMAKLKELTQDGLLQDYLEEFEHLMTLVKLPEGHLVSCFISGLQPSLQYPIRMFQPQTLKQAITLAKL